MTKQIFSILVFFSLMFLVVIGCKKTEITTPPELATFTGETGGSFQILGAGTTKKIPVGVTTVSDKARTISFTVTSPTGAVEGTHYTLSGHSVTIPAGQSIDSITVTGIYPPYNGTGRKDSLIFKLNTPDVNPSEYNDTYKLLLRGPCFEGDIVLSELIGNYTKTVETLGTGAPYGPYTTSISSAVSTGPTSARIVVNNIWDNGWGPITWNLDWSNLANPTAIVVAQDAISGSNAADVGYSGTMAIRPFSGQPGTYSYCKGTLTLKAQLGVTGLGYFGSLYTVNMAR